MISAGRESTVAGGHDGHSATTDAGEDSSEVKYQASDGTSKAQATSCETEVLPPTSSISESGTGSDGNASEQQPMRKSTLGRPGDCKKAEASRGDAGAESMSLLARASRVSENQESTTPSGSAEPSPSKLAPLSVPLDGPTNQSMAGMPLTSALASPACLHGTGADIPLLASLGQQISTVDRANHQARTSPSNARSSHNPSQLPIPGTSPAGQPRSKAGTALRRGKWTVEEETYVARVIQDFNSGFLNAPAGTTLRSYLSEKLQCDPMRITKKFTGDACIGKRVFHPAVRNPSNAAAIDKAQADLDALERRWRRRLEMQQRESAKKAAASAAAAAAASGRNHGFITQNGMGAGANGGNNGTYSAAPAANGVTQTASWLDRASNVLKETGSENDVSVRGSQQKFSLTQEQAQALQSLPKKEIEMQMKEVERLIHEGPIIQQTSAGLPLVLHQSPDIPMQQPPPVPTTIVAPTSVDSGSEGQQTPPEPADKRMRTTGAEDAEALVGFLTAVRASAAAGTDSFSN